MSLRAILLIPPSLCRPGWEGIVRIIGLREILPEDFPEEIEGLAGRESAGMRPDRPLFLAVLEGWAAPPGIAVIFRLVIPVVPTVLPELAAIREQFGGLPLQAATLREGQIRPEDNVGWLRLSDELPLREAARLVGQLPPVDPILLPLLIRESHWQEAGPDVTVVPGWIAADAPLGHLRIHPGCLGGYRRKGTGMDCPACGMAIPGQ